MAQTAKKREPKLVDPDTIAEIAPEIAIPQEMEGETVADTLIRARQQYGQDLRSIAQVLCIRYAYLDAIERANYENLPGPTYAVGFVRTYAEFLGLDGDSVVERFKNEVQGLDGQTKLHFPTPAPEGKMPGGAVFLVAALLFAGAYGVWFYLSNEGETIADLVSPVPEHLQELVTEETPAAAPDLATASAAAPAANDARREAAASPAPSADPAPAAPAEPAATQSAVAPAVAASETTADTTAPAAAPTPSAPTLVESAPVEAAPVESADARPAAATAPSQARPSATSGDGQTAPADSQAAPVITLQQPETPADERPGLAAAEGQTAYSIPAAPANNQASSFLVNQEPQVYGDDNGDVRIVLTATQDAWVQVRDRAGTLLLTRVLRVGDSYRVPNQDDLTLLTGNAGGLEIRVDGTALAPLGPVGAVRRNVPLDPEKLLNGG